MKNKADLREIAENNGLTYAESTSGTNGYPSNIKGIIIGFDNFKDAEELAEKHGLSMIVTNESANHVVDYISVRYNNRLWIYRHVNLAYGNIAIIRICQN